MKKLFTLMMLLLCAVTGVWADSVEDLVAVSPGYTLITDNITSNGTVKLTANTLYDNSRIFANTGNNVATNKGKSTIGDAEFYNSLRLKNTQDQLVFKVASACRFKIYTQTHTERGVQVGSTAGGTEWGKQSVNTNTFECDITEPGLIYLSSFNGDIFVAGFELSAYSATFSVTFENDANWDKVYAYTWTGDGDGKVEHSGAWPGVEISKSEDLYRYSYTGEAAPEKIIFHNGSGSQTADLVFEDGASYNSSGKIVVLDNFTATLTTDLEGDVYAYVWKGEDADKVEALGAWPGTKLEATAGVYAVNIAAEKAPDFIIFHNNDGIQTVDLAFEDGKAYNFVKQDFTVTFTTDAEWEKVYAWAWTGGTNFCEPWPGQELTATADVYSYTYNGYYAPEKIAFNGGDDTKKTSDFAFVAGKAYKWIIATPLYTLQEGDTFTAGQTVEVKDAENDVVATITYGTTGNDFAAATAVSPEGYPGYKALTAGNGTNGNLDGGTTYTIVPKYDGTISIAVSLNKEKVFYIKEGDTALEGYNGITKAEKYDGIFTFDVTADKSYKFYCDGSKLGFYGFDYTGYTKPFVPAEITEVKFAYATEWDNDTHQEWTNGVNVVLENSVSEPNVYTGEIDLKGDTRDMLFKLVVNGGGDESDGWAGWIGNKNLTIEAGDLTIAGMSDDTNANMRMTRTALRYDKYALTATWTPSKKYYDNWSLKIEGVGDATGINTIAADNQQNGTVYDLMGRRVENMQKGLYIVNGRKVVIK